MKNKRRNLITLLVLIIILVILCAALVVMVLVMTGHKVPFLNQNLSDLTSAGSEEEGTEDLSSGEMASGISVLADSASLSSSAGQNRSSSTDLSSVPVETSTPTPTPEPTPDPAKFNTDDTWALILVNKEHTMPEGYTPEVTLVENDQYTDVRCADALTRMLADCRAAGYNPLAISGYRTHETQELYFNNTAQMYIDSGMDEASAEEKAGESVAVPGTSEHELGLSVDIGTTTNVNINDSQDDDPTQLWLQENCWKYGYILRYPPEKSSLTGIIYESWHYRYVGMTAAKVIKDENLCLEEYLQTYVEPFVSLDEINKTAMDALASEADASDASSEGQSQ